MKYIEFDESRPLDLILLGRITIDFTPVCTKVNIRAKERKILGKI